LFKRFILGFLVFMVLACLLAVPFVSISKAQQGPTIALESRHESDANSNLGTITFDSTTYNLPTSFESTYENHPITYNPPPGYSFVRWEIVATGIPPSYVGDPNARNTYIHLDSSTTLRAVYTGSGPSYVGGEFITVNKLAVLAPYLALLGVIGAVFSVYAARRR